jgi:gluconate 2-dehydrogenase gamma chain
MSKISRRGLIKKAGAAGAVALAPSVIGGTAAAQTQVDLAQTAAPAPSPAPRGANRPPIAYIFFNPAEAVFLEAAVARLIPADDRWPGAFECGVTNYIDKQMAGAWGAGERLYRGGPWRQGLPGQGYQLPYTPAELFRTAIGAINKELARTPFAKMTPEQQDAYLKALETGDKDLGGVPGRTFFADLWQATVEGFFSDPVYGGNRDMMAWRMIGFPGAYASYYDLVDKHGITVEREPMSLAQDVQGHIHPEPNIPPKLR